MSMIYGDLSEIFLRGTNSWGRTQSVDCSGETDKTLSELTEEYLEEMKKTKEIRDYTIDTISFDCGPSSEPGAIFVAWVENDGRLDSISYEWETA